MKNMKSDAACSAVQASETYRQAPGEVKEVMSSLAACGEIGTLSVREIICRCPPDWKFCDCDDLAINRAR